MQKINIYGKQEIIDSYYRYKMEKLNVINNSNKRTITNLDNVATNLNLDKAIIIDAFKIYLSCNIIVDKTNIIVTSDKLNYNDFYNVLRNVIEYLVLCPSCGKPEVKLDIGTKNINMICACCSFTGKIIDSKKPIPKQITKIMDNMIKKNGLKKK